MKSEQEIQNAITRYGDTVYRICFMHLKNKADSEDIFQSVFLKYALHDTPFTSLEHEKSWLLKVTMNQCNDLLRNFFRKNTVSIDALIEQGSSDPKEYKDVLKLLLQLPKKYKDVLYLHYYEDYSAPQIADILHKNVNTIYTLLSRGKQLLKPLLQEEGYGKAD